MADTLTYDLDNEPVYMVKVGPNALGVIRMGPDPDQLTVNVVLVRWGREDSYLDPPKFWLRFDNPNSYLFDQALAGQYFVFDSPGGRQAYFVTRMRLSLILVDAPAVRR